MAHKEKMGKLKGHPMPNDHFEHDAKQAPVCGEKYSSEFGNPESLDRMTEGLAGYVKKNKMKYE